MTPWYGIANKDVNEASNIVCTGVVTLRQGRMVIETNVHLEFGPVRLKGR